MEYSGNQKVDNWEVEQAHLGEVGDQRELHQRLVGHKVGSQARLLVVPVEHPDGQVAGCELH